MLLSSSRTARCARRVREISDDTTWQQILPDIVNEVTVLSGVLNLATRFACASISEGECLSHGAGPVASNRDRIEEVAPACMCFMQELLIDVLFSFMTGATQPPALEAPDEL